MLSVLILRTALNLYGHGTTTHATISANAFGVSTNIQSHFFQALGISPGQLFVVGPESRTAQSWIVQGSIREDTEPLPVGLLDIPIPKMRVVFHFFDPQNDRGLTSTSVAGPLSASPSPLWAIQGVGSGTIGFISFSSVNEFPYASSSSSAGARGQFFSALTLPNSADRNEQTGLMFRSLGQSIHLIQDAAQPQHVRNDQHLDLGIPDPLHWFQNPSVYERYVDARPDLQTPAVTYRSPTFPLPQDFFANGSGAGLAEFANQNFVSAGTNCTTFVLGQCGSVGGYPLPVINGFNDETFADLTYGGDVTQCESSWVAALFPDICTQGVVRFFGDNVHDANTGNDDQNDRMTTFSIFDQFLIATNHQPVFTLNHFNYDRQAAFLIPRATAYSAGLLNYFFRGAMSVRGTSAAFQITNNTLNGSINEDMDGTFALYYDATDEQRHPVPEATWQLSISGGSTSSPLSFAPPTSPPPTNPGTYILVFKGTMGSENEAAAGEVFQLADGPLLTIAKSGSGSGRVTSNPAGIDCGSTCSAIFDSNSRVTLTPAAAPGSVFAGWIGAGCVGLRLCTVTIANTTSVSATFIVPPPGVVVNATCTYRPPPDNLFTLDLLGTASGGQVYFVFTEFGLPFFWNGNPAGSCSSWTLGESQLSATKTCTQTAGEPSSNAFDLHISVHLATPHPPVPPFPIPVTVFFLTTDPPGYGFATVGGTCLP